MAKPPLVARLDRQIRHHREMMHKYWNNPVKHDYHERWRLAAEKELAEYLKNQGATTWTSKS
jgi:hypothetical protein